LTDVHPFLEKKKFTFFLGYMHQEPARYLGKKSKKQCKEVFFFSLNYYFLGTNEKNVRHFEKQNTTWYAPRGS